MRILVVSDIHGNRAALEAVAAEPHDAVICLGDIVGYGPEPRACVEWVQEHATWVVQGNHDLANADGVSPRCRPNFAWLADAVVPLTRNQLDDGHRSFLRGLPRWAVRDIGGVRIACFHASPSDPLYGYCQVTRSSGVGHWTRSKQISCWSTRARRTPCSGTGDRSSGVVTMPCKRRPRRWRNHRSIAAPSKC